MHEDEQGMMNAPMISAEQAQMIPSIVQQMMGPLVEAMAKLLENNTRALNQLAAAQQTQSDRLEALEKQIRLNTPVTRQQARYLSAAIKEKALEMLDKYAIDEAKAVRKLSGIIRKEVLSDYGITGMEEIPRHEYSVAMNSIRTWNSMRSVRDVVKEARQREEGSAGMDMETRGRTAHRDGQAQNPSIEHQ